MSTTGVRARKLTYGEVVSTVEAKVEVGDAVLVGGSDPYSVMTQIGEKSRFSHIAVCTEPGTAVEAYDYALLPDERSEGVYRLSINEYLTRSKAVRTILVLRPPAIDRERFEQAARDATSHSPYFASTGVFLLASCGLMNPVLRFLPEQQRRALLDYSCHLTGDGTRTVQCAELAVRLYAEAGVEPNFASCRLAPQVEFVRHRRGADLDRMGGAERVAQPARWPAKTSLLGVPMNAHAALTALAQSLSARHTSTDPADWADFILPGDFEHTQNFSTVAEFSWSTLRRTWSRQVHP